MIRYNGLKFKNVAHAARHAGISTRAMQNRLRRGITDGANQHACVHCKRDMRKCNTYVALEQGDGGFIRRVEYCAHCYTLTTDNELKRKE